MVQIELLRDQNKQLTNWLSSIAFNKRPNDLKSREIISRLAYQWKTQLFHDTEKAYLAIWKF